MKWQSSFSYLPINYRSTLAVVKDLQQDVTFFNNLNGNALRIRFSNKYSTVPLRLASVKVSADGKSWYQVTSNENSKITIPTHEEFYSDPVKINTYAGQKITIRISINGPQKIESVCGFWAKGLASVRCFNTSKNYPMDRLYEFVAKDPSPLKGQFFYGFSSVQILTNDDAKLVVAFGDSITHMSFLTNALTKRLNKKFPGTISLINAGIGGNRLVHDATWIPDAPGEGSLFGRAGVERFENDVYQNNLSVDDVLILIGINDLLHPLQFEYSKESTNYQYIQLGYQKIVELAHKHHSKVFAGTISPCRSKNIDPSWLTTIKENRKKVNEWIRKAAFFGAVIDYDRVLRDPNQQDRVKEGLTIGDGLHPNEIGGKLMADLINVKQL